MVRVPYVNRDDLDAKGQEIYDRIRQDRKSAEVGLQFRALLNNPEAAGYLTSMGAQLRFQSSVPDNLKELAIILVAREWNSDIEWTGHALLAARAGVSDQSIESVRTRKTSDVLTGQEATVALFVHEMVQDKKLSDSTFAAFHSDFGDRGVVDLTLTVAYYSALALAQIALELEMEPGRASTL